MSIPTDPTSKISRIVGDYVLVRVLGRGTFGTAFEARHRVTGLRWVVKEIAPGAGEAEHPQLEALYTASSAEISNHVLRTHTYFFDEHEGIRMLYVVSEFIEHGSLHAFLRAHQALTVEEALDIALGIAHGLVAVHARGVMHLDLKPGNVLMDHKDGRWVPKIADFGQARPQGATTPSAFASPGYAAPEQLSGEAAPSASSDLFPFGMMLAELLLARPVAPGGAIGEYRVWLATELQPQAIAAECATRTGRAELLDLVTRLLQLDPNRRPSAAEVVQRLTAILGVVRGRLVQGALVAATLPIPPVVSGQPDVTVAVSRAPRPLSPAPARRRTVWLWPALGALVIAVWAVVQIGGRDDGTSQSVQRSLSAVTEPAPVPPAPVPVREPRVRPPASAGESVPARGGQVVGTPEERQRTAVPSSQPTRQVTGQSPGAGQPAQAAATVVPAPVVTQSAALTPAAPPVVSPGAVAPVLVPPQTSVGQPAVTSPSPEPLAPVTAVTPARQTLPVVSPPFIQVRLRRACGTNPLQGSLDGVTGNVERGLRARGASLDGPRVVVVAAGFTDIMDTGVELRGQLRVCGESDAGCQAFTPDCSEACSFSRARLRQQNRDEALNQLAEAIAAATAARSVEAESVCSR